MKRSITCFLLLSPLWIILPAAAETGQEMIFIEGGVHRLGGDTEDMVRAAEQCTSDLRGATDEAACGLDRFSSELGPNEPTEIPPFFMDRTEVSLGRYLRCVRARRCRAPALEYAGLKFRDPRLPVVFVSFDDAQDYCAFRGARLPTESEFEWAARGRERREYPWGRFFRWGLANAGTSGPEETDTRDGVELLAPVDSFASGATKEGVLQLSGNAEEWTSSLFYAHGTNSADQSTTTGPSVMRVVKGGSFADAPAFLRASSRNGVAPSVRTATVGFRCARDAEIRD